MRKRRATAARRKQQAKIKPHDIADAKRMAFKDVPGARAAFASTRKTAKGAKGPIPD